MEENITFTLDRFKETKTVNLIIQKATKLENLNEEEFELEKLTGKWNYRSTILFVSQASCRPFVRRFLLMSCIITSSTLGLESLIKTNKFQQVPFFRQSCFLT